MLQDGSFLRYRDFGPGLCLCFCLPEIPFLYPPDLTISCSDIVHPEKKILLLQILTLVVLSLINPGLLQLQSDIHACGTIDVDICVFLIIHCLLGLSTC